MKVLQLIAGLDIGELHGGAERFGAELALALHARGIHVEVCAFWHTGSPVEQAWLDRLRSKGLVVWSAAGWHGHGMRGLPAYVTGLSALAQHCRACGYDLLHSHFQLGSLAGLALRQLRITHKAIRTAHITHEWGLGAVHRLLRAATDMLYPLLMDGEAGVSAAVCRRLDGRLCARLLRKSATFVPNAIFLPVPAKSTEYRSAPPYRLGALGRLVHQKGFDLLLEAFHHLVRQGEDVRLVIAGEGRERHSLEKQIRAYGLTTQVELVGAISDGPEFIQKLDLLVLSSRYEGLSTTLLEAVACGIPVAAFRIPGNQEVVDENSAWLADPENSLSLAEQIHLALGDPVERTRRAANTMILAQKNDLAAIAGEYEQFYRR